MLEALCRQSSTTLDIVHAEDGPPITQRTSGLGSGVSARISAHARIMQGEALEGSEGSLPVKRDIGARLTSCRLRISAAADVL